MRYLHVYTLSLLFVLSTSCGQSQTTSSEDSTRSEAQNPAPFYGSNERGIHSKYGYADSAGKRLIIQNSLPRGASYTDPDGKKYMYAVFWTRIINETANPVEATIAFPADTFEIPSSPGVYMKLLLPSDTMTPDKNAIYDYGLAMKSFLDKHRNQPASLKRTIHPKSSSAFYVVALSTRGTAGILRTEFSLRGQELFYRINDKEIPCGRINLKNLKLLE